MDCITYTARISCVDYDTYSTCSASNDRLSFPHINNSRPRHGESSKGPKTPPHPTHHQPGRSWLHTLRARLPSTDIAHGHSPDIPIIALNASSYPILASPIHAGPDIMPGCPSRKALSGRTWHNIRPDYATQSRTVLHHRDTDRITPSMPYHDPHSENQKDSKMSHPLYGQLTHFAIFVRKFYFGPSFTH